ncbi:MAG: hypothetical protein P4M08_01065 [Oligoflexia bacterium]|nr:hypothetical protein [Oligoflexia bacterium]
MKNLTQRLRPVAGGLFIFSLFQAFHSQTSWACACGCGVFDVGTSAMFPTESGNMAFFEYDYMDQSNNWSGTNKAPAEANNDKEIRTHFLTFGDQFMFDRSHGLQLEVPVTFRYFRTLDSDEVSIDTFNHAALGDIRLRGIYTGFSSDMSTGITYGVKLPTGDSTYEGFDPDTEIGSGSTDLLLGAFHYGPITDNGLWNYFAQINLDEPIFTQHGYFPGSEIDAAAGAYYNGLKFDGAAKLAPILQLLTSLRSSDHGGNPAADPLNTGYQRVFISPGVELDAGAFRFYTDVEIPIYQYMNGNQLVAPGMVKTILSYSF